MFIIFILVSEKKGRQFEEGLNSKEICTRKGI